LSGATFLQSVSNTLRRGSLALYIDAQLENRVPKGFASSFSESEPVYVAQSGSPYHMRYFNGDVDDLRIYDRVLSQEEVNVLFNESDPVATQTNDISAASKAVSSYPNPTTDLIHFSAITNAQLSGLAGQIIAVGKNVTTLNVSMIPTGLYFLTLSESDGTVQQRSRIVKL